MEKNQQKNDGDANMLKRGSQFARNSVEVSTPYWSKFGRSLIEVSSCRVAVSNTQVYKVLVFTVFCEYMLSNCDQTATKLRPNFDPNCDPRGSKLRQSFDQTATVIS